MIKRIGSDEFGRAVWLCRCACGNSKESSGKLLRAGKLKSCGCLQPEVVAKRNFKHGLCTRGNSHYLYGTWRRMIQRCEDRGCSDYKKYGARGISVCERWRKSFSDFLRDVGERPDGMTLDRKDTNGNYSPDNFRWATPRQQANNTRRNHIIKFSGFKRTMSEWESETGIPQRVIWYRWSIGWSPRKILTTPHG